MPTLRTYRIFICHAWEYNDDYYRLVDLLNDTANFEWENVSVPEHDPLGADETEGLEYEIRNQIRPAHVLVLIAGMYVPYREWIDFELRFARRIGVPVVGVLPWGSRKSPAVLGSVASEVVGWNRQSIVDAIRRVALPST